MANIITGTEGVDNPITGTSGDDIINGLGGDDTINGNNGVDIIDGGDGNDTVSGGSGNDQIHGGAGNDTLNGLNDDDSIWGDDGADTINGGSGDDHLYGGAGNDTLVGGSNTLTGKDVAHINADAASSIGVWSGSATPGAGTLTLTTADGVDRISQVESLVFNNRTFTVSGNNVVAALAADTASTDEDVNASGNVLSNDINLDGTLSVTSFNNGGAPVAAGGSLTGAHGVLTLAANGAWNYVPASNEQGVDVFTYTVNDGGVIQTQTLTITINNINDAPVANATSASGLEDQAITGTVTASDIDNAPGSLTYAVADGPSHGSVVVNPNGTFTYTPALNYFGPDSFTFTASDGSTTSTAQAVTLSVTAVNDRPVATDDMSTVAEDGVLNASLSASDVDDSASALSYAVATGPVHGQLTVQPDGTFSYAPAADFNGADSFTWTVTDAAGLTSTGTYSITVSPVNDTPTAIAASNSGDEDTPITGFLTGSDVDANSTLTYGASSQPAHGTVSVDNATGAYTYTPQANYFGPDSFTFVVYDGGAALSAPQTITLTVNPVNDAPVGATTAKSGAEDTDITGTVVAADVDNSNAQLTYSLGNQAQHGTVVFQADGSYVYTPNDDYNGPDSFTWSATDPSGAIGSGTVNLTVTAVDDAPRAADLTLGGTEDNTVLITIPDNDVDGQPQRVTSVGGLTILTGGTVAVEHGSVTLQADGNLLFTPAADYHGPVDFDYVLNDGTGFSYSNTSPYGAFETGSVPAGITTFGGGVASIETPGVTIPGAPGGVGRLQVTQGVGDVIALAAFAGVPVVALSGYSFVAAAAFQVTVATGPNDRISGSFYIPATDDAVIVVRNGVVVFTRFNGSQQYSDFFSGVAGLSTYTFIAIDGGAANGAVTTWDNLTIGGQPIGVPQVTPTGGLSDTGHVHIDLSPVNDAPTAAPQSFGGTEDTEITGTLTGGADIDSADLTYHLDSGPEGLVLNPDGTFSYTPDANVNGAVTFTYTVKDGALSSAPATVTLNFTATNDAPVASEEVSIIATEDVVFSGTLPAASDVDGVDTLTYALAEDGDAGHGLVVLNPNGSYTYTPVENFHGTDSFTYTVSDGHGGVATSSVSITVNPVNDAPVADVDSTTGDEDSLISGSVSASDIDGTDELTYVLDGNDGNDSLVLHADGTFTYQPEADFNGDVTFSFHANDGTTDSASVTHTIHVTPVNDDPTAGATSNSGDEDTEIGGVIVAPGDIDGDTSFTFAGTSQPTHGSVTVEEDGSYIYRPDPDFAGSDSFSYKVSDGNGGFATGTVTLTVNPVDDAPRAPDATGSGFEDQPDPIIVVIPHSDPDGEAVIVSIGDEVLTLGGDPVQVTGGAVVLNEDGDLEFTPDANFNGTVDFDYTLSNGYVAPTEETPEQEFQAGQPAIEAQEEVPGWGVLESQADFDTGTTYVGSSDGSEVFYDEGAVRFSVDSDGSVLWFFSVPPGGGTVSFELNAAGDLDNAPWSVFVGGVPLAQGFAQSTTSITFEVGPFDTVIEFSLYNNWNGPITASIPEVQFDGQPVGYVAGQEGQDAVDEIPYIPANGGDPGNPGYSDTGHVTINVTAVNDAPVGEDDTASTLEDTAVSINVLANDHDVDFGDDLSVTQINGVALTEDGVEILDGDEVLLGVVTQGEGVLVFTPAENYSGTATFEYTLSDGESSTTATVDVVIAAVNDAPMAQADSATMAEDGILEGQVPEAVDVEGDSYSYAVAEGPANGVLDFHADGSFTYTPTENFYGTDSFTYYAVDSDQGEPATFTITVDSVNDDPGSTADAITTAEETEVTGSVLPHVVDPDDNNNFSFSILTEPEHGTVTIDEATGEYRYTPDKDYVGSDFFEWSVDDGFGGSSSNQVAITVTPVNDAPTGASGYKAGMEDAQITGTLVGADVDGDDLTFTIIAQPSGGTVVVDEHTGAFTFTPNANYNGWTPFSYQVSDGEEVSEIYTYDLNVSPVNDAPVGDDAVNSTDEDTAVTGYADLTDIDGALTYSVGPASNGTVSIDAETGEYTFTPDLNFNGTATFTVTGTDAGNLSATSEVTVTVAPVNDAPVATDYTNSLLLEDFDPITITVPHTDVDGDTVTVTAINGTAIDSESSVAVAGGVVTLNEDGDLVFTPTENFNGTVDFDYTLQEQLGANDFNAGLPGGFSSLNAPATVASPFGGNGILLNSHATTDEALSDFSDANFGLWIGGSAFSFTLVWQADTALSFDLSMSNGLDFYVVLGVDNPASLQDGDFYAYRSAGSGRVELSGVNFNAIGSPSAPVVGQSYTVTFFAGSRAGVDQGTALVDNLAVVSAASDTGHVHLEIAPVNDSPVGGMADNETEEDTSVSGYANIVDVDNDALVYEVSEASHGTVTIDETTGLYTYTPDDDFNGTDTFVVSAMDPDGEGASSTVTITVNAVNDAPTGADASVDAVEDTPYSGQLTANDVDGPALSFEALDAENGTVSLNEETGAYVFTPTANFNGDASFSYRVWDGHAWSEAYTISLDVASVNDAPVGAPAANSTDEDTIVTGHADLTDVDGPLTYTVSAATNGTVTINPETGEYSFKPAADFHGTATFTVTGTDGDLLHAESVVTITVGPVNDAPVAEDKTATMAEDDGSITIDLAEFDVDGDALTVSIGGNSLTLGETVAVTGGTITLLAGNDLKFTPDENFNGDIDFDYVLSEADTSTGDFENGPTLVTIGGATLVPSPFGGSGLRLQADPAITDEAIQQFLGGLGFTGHGAYAAFTIDVDVEAGSYLTFNVAPGVTGHIIITSEYQGTAQAIIGFPSVNWPNPTFPVPLPRADAVHIVVTGAAADVLIDNVRIDGQLIGATPGLSDSGHVHIDVTPVNDSPEGANSQVSGNEDTIITGFAAATDVDHDVLTFSIVGDVEDDDGNIVGSVTIDEHTGAYSFTPKPNFNGEAHFTWSAVDPAGEDASGVVTVTVNPVNDAPVAEDKSATMAEDDGSITIDLAEFDVDGDALTVSIGGNSLTLGETVDVDGGTVTLLAGNNLKFAPEENFNGDVDFDYQLSDGSGTTGSIGTFDAFPGGWTVVGTVVREEASLGSGLGARFGGGPAADGATISALTNGVVTTPGHAISTTIIWHDGQTIGFDTKALAASGVLLFLTQGPNAQSFSFGPGGSSFSSGGFQDFIFDDGVPVVVTIVFPNTAPGAVAYVDSFYQGHQPLQGFLANPGDTGHIHIDVTPVNDSPEGANSHVSGNEDTVITGFAGATDVDEDVLTYAIIGDAEDDDGNVVGTVTIDEHTGKYSFTPNLNFNGDAHFTWSAADPSGDSASGVVTVTVDPVNDAPTVTAGGSRSLGEDATISGQAAGSDLDGDGVTFALSGEGLAGLTFGSDGAWSFNGLLNPAAQALNNGQSLTLTFSYVATDGHLSSAPTTVTLLISGANELFVLTEGVDTFAGTAGGDEIHALGDDDVISGGAGDDLVFGDGGDDLLAGAAGNDVLFGGLGNDTLTGGAGDDVLDGGAGDDVLNGGAGTDLVSYASATGPVNANMTTGTVTGGGIGVDSLVSIEGITGSDYDDVLTGNALANVLIGGLGNDVLNGMGGADTLVGGLGNDTFYVDSLDDVVVELAGQGTDTIVASLNYTLTEGSSIEALTGAGSAGLTLTGNSAGQTITGGQGSDSLYGLGGADVLSGGVGNDLLDGGTGADAMTGGSGNDTFVVDDAGDVTTEALNQGTDTVQAWVNVTLAANIENLMLMGAAALNGTGNTLANTITGNSAANTLDGGDGNDFLYGMDGGDYLLGGLGVDTLDGGAGVDIMEGGAGNDTYIVDNSADQLIELAPNGVDTALASVTFLLGSNLENLTLTGSAAINGTGNELTNIVYGNTAGNSLWGLAGGDQIHGGDGNDVIYGGLGNDQMWGEAGADQFIIENSSMILSGARESDTIKDFSVAQGDRIDLSGIDANTLLGGDQAFSFVSAFTKVAGQATLTYSASLDTTQLRLDVNGDGAYDYQLTINGNVTTGVPILTGSSAPTDGGWLL